MPKKYHRPPTAKRRKSKKTTSPNVLEPLPESQTDNSSALPVAEDVDEAAAPGAVDEYDDEEEDDFVMPAQVAAAARKERQVRHLVADYSYVLGEVRLSLGLAAFLIVALIITGILR